MTEVGIIPSDWDITTLGEASVFLDEVRRPIKSADRESMKGIYPYYGASGIIDYVNDYLFDDELILLGEDGENILSRSVRLAFKVSGKIWVNNHAHVLKPNSSFDIGYLADYLESLDYSIYNSGTAQPKLNKATCKKIPVVKPTVVEQRAIATALSDVDALITSLDTIIDKKKMIKQGAMQELLTPPDQGGKRLEGFSGEWEIKQLMKIASISKGFQLNRDTLSLNGDYPVINGGIEPSGYTSEYNRLRNTITISEGGNSCGFVNLIKTKFWSGGHCYTLEVSSNIISKNFLYWYLKYSEPKIMALRVGSGLPNIQKNRLNSFECIFPTDFKEQKAIAKVLNDMDSVIQELETKRDKYNQIKQGMMQELLTGKTRLI